MAVTAPPNIHTHTHTKPQQLRYVVAWLSPLSPTPLESWLAFSPQTLSLDRNALQ